MFPNDFKREDSVSGVAEVALELHRQSGKLQITIDNVTTGTGAALLELKPAGSDEWRAVSGGSIDLSGASNDSGRTLLIEGSATRVRATSDQSSDEFSMVVGY